MSLEADELLIKKYICEQIITPQMPAGGRVIPAPIYFNDKEDYWATIDTVAYDTQEEIEKSQIMFCCLYFVNFVDIDKKPAHSPLFGILYELHLFQQYNSARADENLTPDQFNKKMLLRHNEFVATALKLKEAFQGERSLGLDSAVYAIQRTTPLVQTERTQNKAATEFVPGITGHLAKFQETVQLKLVAC